MNKLILRSVKSVLIFIHSILLFHPSLYALNLITNKMNNFVENSYITLFSCEDLDWINFALFFDISGFFLDIQVLEVKQLNFPAIFGYSSVQVG